MNSMPDFQPPATAYQAVHKPVSSQVNLRGLNTHLHAWGEPGWPLVVMLHGWMDVGASFQFVVDCMAKQWRVVAPDLRGFGLTDWPVGKGDGTARSYWFGDYLADLDALLDHLSPTQPVHLVGHSMGGNIAMLYAGVRPHRIRSLINLEGFGLLDANPAKAGKRYARWLDELKEPPTLRTYASLEAVAQRLQKTNPRLSTEKALYLTAHWSENTENGYRILGDAAHRISNPIGYRLNEAQAIWASIEAPVLHVEAAQTEAGLWMARQGEQADFDALRTRFECVPDWRFARIDEAGHMLHHDQPAELARLIETHLMEHR